MKREIDLRRVFEEQVKPMITPGEAEMMELALARAERSPLSKDEIMRRVGRATPQSIFR